MKSNIQGLTECLRKLEKLEDAVDAKSNTPKMKSALELVGRKGSAVWQTAYDQAPPMDDVVDTRLRVETNWEGNTLVLSVSDPNILFIEFGTGLRHNYETKFGKSFGYYPASWSEGPEGKGWLVEPKKSIYKRRWVLPKGIVPGDTRGRQNWVIRTWMTKKYGLRKMVYRRKTPIYWAEGHKPINGMWHALREMQLKDTMRLFKIELLK